jgi:triosephosphate isomerase
MIIINFKAFVTGKDALKLAKICEQVSRAKKIPIAVAVQTADISLISSKVSLAVLAQHVDGNQTGAFNGSVLPESVAEAGGVGSLLNHSEKQISLKEIEKAVKRLRQLGLISIVCARTPAEAKKISLLKPDIIAIEPPELIGGKISVVDAKPEIVTRVTHAIHTPVICGAGIHTKKDIRRAADLGAMGVLIASGVVLAKNQKKALESLI